MMAVGVILSMDVSLLTLICIITKMMVTILGLNQNTMVAMQLIGKYKKLLMFFCWRKCVEFFDKYI